MVYELKKIIFMIIEPEDKHNLKYAISSQAILNKTIESLMNNNSVSLILQNIYR